MIFGDFEGNLQDSWAKFEDFGEILRIFGVFEGNYEDFWGYFDDF